MRSLRRRLNLQVAILRIARLLLVTSVERRVLRDVATRLRKSTGMRTAARKRWTTDSELSEEEMFPNSRRAAQQLLKWAGTDAMAEALAAIGGRSRPTFGRGLRCATQSSNCCVTRFRVPRSLWMKAVRSRKCAMPFGSSVSKRRTCSPARFTTTGINSRSRFAVATTPCAERRNRGPLGRARPVLAREVSYRTDARPQGGRNHDGRLLLDGLLRAVRRPPTPSHSQMIDANHLPLGNTIRGGLSMKRLNFLDEVKDFVRKWTCRWCWPGDRRRVPRGA